jgi:hypothetical protein
MSKRILTMFAAVLLFAVMEGRAQEAVITSPENLVVDGGPKIPASLAETAGGYGSYRFAAVSDWHPTRREMLIRTRFAETPQVHLVKMPGGERQQLTFYPDAIANAEFHPNGGDYFVFMKDIGGGEWYQLYRYDMETAKVTLLTDGKSRNLLGSWSSGGDQIAYVSTRRTGQDTDLWVMNPADPKSDHLLTQLKGGGWQPIDWSPDDKNILLQEEISIVPLAGERRDRRKDCHHASRHEGEGVLRIGAIQQRGKGCDHRSGLGISAACVSRHDCQEPELFDERYSLGRGGL